MPLDIGTAAPDFILRNQAGAKISLGDLKGSKATIVFIPFPFTSTCTAELCQLRDGLAIFNKSNTRLVVITTHATSTNAEWARQEGFEFDILADYWPHGDVARQYDAFDERFGFAKRVTYFLDADAIVRDVLASDVLGVVRDYDRYAEILADY